MMVVPKIVNIEQHKYLTLNFNSLVFSLKFSPQRLFRKYYALTVWQTSVYFSMVAVFQAPAVTFICDSTLFHILLDIPALYCLDTHSELLMVSDMKKCSWIILLASFPEPIISPNCSHFRRKWCLLSKSLPALITSDSCLPFRFLVDKSKTIPENIARNKAWLHSYSFPFLCSINCY